MSLGQGSISEFDVGNAGEWPLYVTQLENFFKLNNITENNKKVAALLCLAGRKVIEVIHKLMNGPTTDETEYENIINKLSNYFSPQPSKFMARLTLRNRRQQRGENIRDFDISLRQLVRDCQYGEFAEQALLDQLLWGMNEDRLRQNLLMEPDLTYDIAIRKGIAYELVIEQAMCFRGKINDEQSWEIHKTEGKKQSTNTKEWNDRGKQIKCFCCGQQGHISKNCKWRSYTCYNCGRKGHLKSVCRNPKTQDKQHTEYEVKKNVCAQIQKQYMITLNIYGKDIEMEIDSGSAISLLSEEKWNDITKGHKRCIIQKTNIRVKDVSGNTVIIKGKTQIPIRYKEEILNLPIYIVKGSIAPIIGREWFEQLGITVTIIKNMSFEQEYITAYPELFSEQVGVFKSDPVDIELSKNARPIVCKPRKIPFAQHEKVKQKIQKLVSEGVLTPVEDAQWATPIVIVTKPNGQVRICGDYRVTVNKFLAKGAYPVPNVRELLAGLANENVFFAKLDLNAAYHQIKVTNRTAQMLTLTTPFGLFQCNRLPFGVTTAPNIFQAKLSTLLHGIQGVTPYYDDILITATTESELRKRLTKVCNKLKDAGIKLNKEKCLWKTQELEFLGHVISNNGKRPIKDKVRAVKNAQRPKNVKQLQAFLGLINFFEIFLKSKAMIANPLYQLLRKGQKWEWTQIHEEAFEKTKELLSADTLLTHFDNALEVRITTDASEIGVGAVLAHPMENGERPIAYASRTLSKAERNYSQIDKEALAIIFALRKYHQFVFGRPFQIITDHKPLLAILGNDRQAPEHISPRMLRWRNILAAYDYVLIYKPGKEIAHADALSRLPDIDETGKEELEINYIDAMKSNKLNSKTVEMWTREDKGYKKLIEWIRSEWPETKPSYVANGIWSNRQQLSICKGCIVMGDRVLIPTAGRQAVLKLLHEGHPGIVRAKALARSYVWWPKINEDIEHYIKKCSSCQTYAAMPQKNLTSWQPAKKPWERVHIDHAGPVDGKMLLILVDAKSRWIEAHKVRDTTANEAIKCLKNIFAIHGYPEVLVSDNGAAFTGTEMQQFCEEHDIQQVWSPPYHPQSNGLAENAVQQVKQNLRKTGTKNIQETLQMFMMTQHTTPSTATGKSPAEILCGRKLRTKLTALYPKESNIIQHDEMDKEFRNQEPVWFRDILRKTWIQGTIKQRMSNKIYEINGPNERIYRRHINHMRRRMSDEWDWIPNEDKKFDTKESGINSTGKEEEERQIAIETNCEDKHEQYKNKSPRPTRNRRLPERFKDYV